MSQQFLIKKVLTKKFSAKTEYNFDDFCVIMEDYQFLLFKSDKNYKNEMKNIFGKCLLNDDGFARNDDIINILSDIIINALNTNNNNSDSEYKLNENGFESNDEFYIHQINTLKKQVETLELDKEDKEDEYNTLKQERIEYENAYNNILNELNEYKIRNDQMDDIQMSVTMLSQTSKMLSEDNIELTNNYDDLNKKYKNLANIHQITLNELNDIKTLNNELKSLNNDYVKVNESIKERNVKNESELNRLRNIVIDLESKLYKTPIPMKNNDSNISAAFDDIPTLPNLENEFKAKSNHIYQMKLNGIVSNKPNNRKSGVFRRSTMFNKINNSRMSYISQNVNDLQTQLLIDNDSGNTEQQYIYDDEMFEQELRAQIEDELKAHYKVRVDQMQVQHKIKINEAKNYYQNKLKACAKQANDIILNLQKSINHLNDSNFKLKKKLKKFENNARYATEHGNGNSFCKVLWKGWNY